MKPFPIPVRAELDAAADALSYLQMPQQMRTWEPSSWPDSPDFQGNAQVLEILGELAQALGIQQALFAAGQVNTPRHFLTLTQLPEPIRSSLDQVLGEGEVSARVLTPRGPLLVQETVFAGIWRLRQQDLHGNFCEESLEVARFPGVLRHAGTGRAQVQWPPHPTQANPNLLCAPALLSEIRARIQSPESHIINLTLLPYTPEDGIYLDQCLGRAQITALSRGYGNCRITATQVPRVWWVQFFNSQDVLILNTIEITEVPEAMIAAPEDLEDSQERLQELIQWLEQPEDC